MYNKESGKFSKSGGLLYVSCERYAGLSRKRALTDAVTCRATVKTDPLFAFKPCFQAVKKIITLWFPGELLLYKLFHHSLTSDYYS